MLNLEADNDTLREYERIMGLNEDVLRFMNISIEEVEEGPSVMMQGQRAERAERAPRGDERGDEESETMPVLKIMMRTHPQRQRSKR